MKHKTWFRLVVKAIGILLIALGLPEAIMGTAEVIYAYRVQRNWSTATAPMPVWEVVLWQIAPPVLRVILGLYLLLGGEWLVNFVIPSNRRYCPDCGHDVSEPLGARTCAECGATLPPDQDAGGTAPGRDRVSTDS